MPAPQIIAKIIDDTVVLSDEFTWGTVGRFPLRWRILQVSEDGIIATTVGTVSERAFSDDCSAWDESALRTWLNEAFLEEHLDQDAAACLLPFVGNDLVAVLSLEEARTFFGQDAARVAEGDNRNWWLRDAGGAEGFQAYVHNNGWINEYGAEANSTYASVRPAIKLDVAEVQLALPSSGGDIDNPYQLANAASLMSEHNTVLASEYGEELMLEALDAEDIFLLEEFVEWFGVHESWETTMVDTLADLSAEGDSLQITRLLDMCNGIEFMGLALSKAMVEGHVAAAGTLLRAGAKLDGSTSRTRLVGDTPELRRIRKNSYPKESELCDAIVTSENGSYSVSTLIRQNLINGRNYYALLRAAGKNEETEDLFEWMLCPNHMPLNRMGAYLTKKRICVVDHPQSNCFPVSEWALQMLWFPKLTQEDPETVRAMAIHLNNPDMEDRRELVCFLARAGHMQELQAILAGKKVFSPKDIAAAADAAQDAGQKKIANYLRDFLKSIGAGKLLQKD